MRYVLFLTLSVLLIIPIFYLALCYYYDLNILRSFHILPNLYQEYFINKSKLDKFVYVSMAYGLLPLFLTLITMVKLRIKPSYGYAKMALLKDIKKMKYISFTKGFILGLFKGKELRSDNPLSMAIFAPPDAGKTSGYVIPNLLEEANSSFVTDIKGEIYETTANYREKKLGNEIYVFDPYGDNNNYHFNPFDKESLKGLPFEKIMILVDEIAEVIFVEEKTMDSHWIEQAKMFFIFLSLFEIEKKGGANLSDIQRIPKKEEDELLTEKQIEEKKIIEEMQEIKISTLKFFFSKVAEDQTLDEITRDYARDYSRVGDNEMKSIITTFSRKMKIFIHPTVKSVVSKNSFSIDDLRKKKITVYAVMKEKDIPALSPLIRLWKVYYLQNLMLRANKDASQRITFYEDEFIRFGKIKELVNAPALTRGYGLKFVFIAQSPSQIAEVYGEKVLESLRDSISYYIYFPMNNYKRAKETAETIGNLTREKVSEQARSMDILSNQSKSKEGYTLITAQDFLNLKDDEVIILVYRHFATPIKAKVNYYFKQSKYKKIIKKYGTRSLKWVKR